jgi:nucleotide-binding universal stress UspA family protein
MAAKVFNSVLIGFDGSEQAQDALALGRLLGSIDSSEIVLAHVAPHQPPFERQTRVYAQARREKVHALLEPAFAALDGREGVGTATIDATSAARGLYDLAHEYGREGAGVLTIGSTHRSSLGRVLVGSVGEVLIAGCPCPVAVAPRGFAAHAPDSITTVVAGLDGSPESRAAVAVAGGVTRGTGARLRVVSVTRDGSSEAAQEVLDEVLAATGGSADGAVLDGNPAERLAEAAHGADLLVLGARSYGPGHHVFVGSVSAKLMRTAPCPVLVLPRPATEAER